MTLFVQESSKERDVPAAAPKDNFDFKMEEGDLVGYQGSFHEFKAERDREVEKEPAAENPNDFNDKKKEDLVGFQGSYQKFLHSRDAKIPVLEISLGPLRS